jgi:TRAP transporter TAXI family solute receptor
MTLSAITSAGSGANIKLLRDKEAQFAILQGLYGAWAAAGTGAMKASGKQEKLRSVTMLWQNVEHFVIDNKYKKTGNVSDLKGLYGENFGIGKKNSGTEGSGRHILAGLGVDASNYTMIHKNYSGTSEALQNGQVAGMNIPAGPPVSAITSVLAKSDSVSILNFTDAQVKQANNGLDLWQRYVIPANTYPGQKAPIKTISQPNFLVTHEDVSEQDVYLLTKAIYENLGFLGAIHKATKVMALENAIAGLPVPLHPGAAKYYKEQGIKIPNALIAK